MTDKEMNMIYFLVFMTTVVLYTVASCMDGPDLKPRWKKWLGMKLEGYANELKPIDYCLRDRCKFYNKATYDLPMYIKQYEKLIHNIAKMNALNSSPCVFISNYDVKKIEKAFRLSENEIFEARMQEEWARQGGHVPFLTVDGIVARYKEFCVKSVLDAVKPFITIEEDRGIHYPDIMIRGNIYVGIRKI